MDIVRPLPLGEQIAAVLRREIITGELPTEAPVREEVLAERFGVSRGPIRDALKQLETEHLVRRGGRSYTVIGIADADIDEIYAVRRALESIGWTVLTDDPSASRFVEPEGVLARMAEAASVGDVAAVAAADVDFHTSVVRASGLTRLTALWDLLEPSIRMILEVTNSLYSDLPAVVAKHEALLALARTGDRAAMAEGLDEHLRSSRGYLPLHDSAGGARRG